MVRSEFSFREACRQHDRCYDTCNNKKIWCDVGFLVNTQMSCSPGNLGCHALATQYFQAVLYLGSDAYKNGQDKNCNKCK